MHMTTRAKFDAIKRTRILEAPEHGASWSESGPLRAGDVAIRLKPGAEQFVEMVEAGEEGHGLVTRYYEQGVGKGEFKSYIPTKYLQYFDVARGEWVDVPQE